VVDLILRNGALLTQDSGAPAARALAVRAGRIVAVGRDEDVVTLAGPATRTIDLGGRTVVPGFNDAHAHLWKIGHLLTTMVDLRGATSLGEVGERLQRAAPDRPAGAWLLGRGYNEARLAEGRPPARQDLDRLFGDRPVMLTRTCGHICSVNSAALSRAGITRDSPDPPGGVIDRRADGEPSGLLHETAMGLVTACQPAPTSDDYAAMIGAALRHQLALGITSSTDAGVSPPILEAYRRMDREHALPVRVNVMALRMVEGSGLAPLPARHESDYLRVDTIKLLADGGLSGATAALTVPYRHADTRGVLRFADDELLALAGEAYRRGYRLAIHAIGDATIDQVLGVFESLGPGGPRPRIEHLGLPDARQLARASRLGAIAVPQTVFLPALGRNFRRYLPDGFLPRVYPVRAMLDAGLTVALSSDAPVVESDDPLLGLRAAVDRLDDAGEAIAGDQAITVAEGLSGYTLGGAVASGDEANRGSLAVGKWADLAVLSGDPVTTPAPELTTLRVEQTWVAGQLAYEG